jgi:hypothetical protein
MSDGITIRILGDFGPFSRMGKSIGYQVTIGESSYLIDCGAPHCHDDHKRWFTDLSLFNMYAPDVLKKVFLITAEDIHKELVSASGAALDRSLSRDSGLIVDIPHEEYVDHRILGPRAKYRIASVDEGSGRTGLYVVDRRSDIIGPDKAKIIISKKTKRPRMLFKDPVYKEWIEPESFYSFSSDIFYEDERNIYKDTDGFTLEAIKAPVWHGIPTIGIRIMTGQETLIFSSDTVHDVKLWKRLYREKRPQQFHVSRDEFESSSVIYGDINDYNERIWSEERFHDAVNTFKDAVVVHDIATRGSAVHTNYWLLKNSTLNKDKTILTHGPDRLTSEWVLCNTEKHFKIRENRYYEVVGNEQYPLNADIYYKEGGGYFVGYRNEDGIYTVYEKDGLLSISKTDITGQKPLYRIDLYEDIGGQYFPKLEDKMSVYRQREDGKVELVETTEEGSTGKVVKCHRERLLKR